MKFKNILISLIAMLLIGFIEYYFFLPSIDINNTGSWIFVINLIVIYVVVYSILNAKNHRLVIKNTYDFKKKHLIIPGLFLLFVIVMVINIIVVLKLLMVVLIRIFRLLILIL